MKIVLYNVKTIGRHVTYELFWFKLISSTGEMLKARYTPILCTQAATGRTRSPKHPRISHASDVIIYGFPYTITLWWVSATACIILILLVWAVWDPQDMCAHTSSGLTGHLRVLKGMWEGGDDIQIRPLPSCRSASDLLAFNRRLG